MTETAVAAAPDDGRPDPTRLTHKQAINRMKDLRDELERIGAKQNRTPEDDRHFAEGVAEVQVLDQHVRNLERDANLARVRAIVEDPRLGKVEDGVVRYDTSRWSNAYDADPILEPDSVEMKRFRNPWDLSEVRTFSRSKQEVGQELQSRALSAIERMSGANDKVREAATGIIEQWDDGESRIARLCLATSSPEYLRAWSKLARGRQHLLTPDEQNAVSRAMSLTDSEGGYLVPFQLDPTVIITADGSLNQIRQVARRVVATGDVWNGVSAGAVSWSWDGEETEVSDDSPTFNQPSIAVHKAAGFVPISIEAFQDEANVTGEVARLLAFGRDVLEASAFINGTGSGQPTGIVTALDAASPSVTVTSAATFALDDVYALDDALPARYRANASWLAHRQTYNDVRQFDTAGGAGLWVRLPGDVPGQMIGRRTYEAEDMDVPGTTGNEFLIYGDFMNYVIADRVGMTVEFIPHLFGTTANRPTGQRGWYAYYRVGADSVNDGAFRMLEQGS